MRQLVVDGNETETVAVNACVFDFLIELVGQDAVFFRNDFEGFNFVELFNAVFNEVGNIFEAYALSETIGVDNSFGGESVAGGCAGGLYKCWQIFPSE